MQTAERAIKMMKIIVTLFLLTATTASAGLFDKDVKVRNSPCLQNKIYEGALIVWTFTVEKSSVIQKQEVYVDKVLKDTDINRLENCIVIDKKNWKCGGALNRMPNGDVYGDRTYKVSNGKYTFTESTRNETPTRQMYCKIEQVN
jgi:hypothetical protein